MPDPSNSSNSLICTYIYDYVNRLLEKRNQSLTPRHIAQLLHQQDTNNQPGLALYELGHSYSVDQYLEWIQLYLYDQRPLLIPRSYQEEDLEIPGTIEDAKRLPASELRDKLLHFYQLPFYPQKSQEWLNQRNQYLTASTISTVIGLNGLTALRQLFLEKVSYGTVSNFHGNEATQWGNKYEPVANAVYCLRQGTRVHEFGLIPSRRWPFLGVSPDGITEQGRMLEIKCPYSRQINGKIKDAYYHQMQEQMWVCDFQECHFLECTFKEIPEGQFWLELPFYQHEQGIIITYVTSADDLSPKYLYSPVKYSQRPYQLLKWRRQQVASCSGIITNESFWRLTVYNCQLVRRDPLWMESYLPKLKHFWEQVVHWRSIDQGLSQLQKMSLETFRQTLFPDYKPVNRYSVLSSEELPEDFNSQCLL